MLLAAVAVYAIITQGADSDPFRRGMIPIIEAKMAKWKPGKIDQTKPADAIWVKGGDISGRWSTTHFFDGTTLSLTPIGGNRYQVEFDSHGCMARWTLSRTATFADGTLIFDKAVEEYAPAKYDRVFLVRLNGKLRLVSPTGLDWINRRKAEKDRIILGMHSFECVSKDPKSKGYVKL